MLNWCIWYHTNWFIGQKHDFWPYFDLIWPDDLWPWAWPLTCSWHLLIGIDSMLNWCIWYHTNWLIGQKHDFWPYFDLIWQDDLWPWAWPLTCRWHLLIGIDSMLNWCIWYYTNWLISQKHDFQLFLTTKSPISRKQEVILARHLQGRCGHWIGL